MKGRMKYRLVLSHVFFALALSGCGGGGGSSGDGGGTVAPANTTISGTASKGTLKNALVRAYQVTGGQKGSVLGTTHTDSSGNYQLTITGYTGPVWLEMTNDTSTTMTCDIPAGCGAVPFGQDVGVTLTMNSVLPNVSGGSIQSAITPFTHMAAQLALQSGLTPTEIEKDLNQVASLFNLPALTGTQPTDITKSLTGSESVDSQHYALLNAAIGQLAGSPGNLNTTLDHLVSELHANNGQLINKSAVTDPAHPDLEDVLSAAAVVAASSQAASHVDSLVSTIVNEDRNTAIDKGPVTTNAGGGTLPGATDIAKAKAFAQSAHNLADAIRAASSTSLLTQMDTKYAPVKAILNSSNGQVTDEEDDLPSALEAATTVLVSAADNAVNNISPAPTVQQILDANFNCTGCFGESFTATAGTVASSVDTINHVATLNGTFKISHSYTYYDFFTLQPVTISLGSDQTFTLTNFKLQYPDFSTPLTVHSVKLLKNSQLDGTSLHLKLGDDSGLVLSYTTADSLDNRLTAINTANLNGSPLDGLLPNSLSFNLKNATLGLSGVGISGSQASFIGNIGLSLNKVGLTTQGTTTTSQSLLPSLLSLSGTFNGLAGDTLNASLTLDLSSSNPLISSAGNLVEDTTHFGHGALSMQATLNLTVGSTTENASIRLDAARNALEGGNGTLTIILNGNTIKLTSAVVGGVASYTLADGNGVSVNVDLTPDQQGLALMVNGAQVGTIYSLYGLPVARFADNSIMAL